VEEEFALLDPVSGAVSLVAPEVIEACHAGPAVGAESMRYMVETRTPVCRTLDQLAVSLTARRAQVAAQARHHGAVMVASGVAPFGVPDPPPLTEDERYRRLLEDYPRAMRTTGTCACHVHVSVPDPDAGVAVLNRLRPWLPALIALAANSPIWRGRHSGWASARYVFATRWPTAIPAPPARSAHEYEHAVRTAIDSGAAFDSRSVYFLARLSPRYPTVEVRVADTCLSVDETVAYAGLVRAVAGQVLAGADEGNGGGPGAVTQDVLAAACRLAARAGLTGCLLDPTTRRLTPAWDYIDRLVVGVLPCLARHGDAERVLPVLEQLRTGGGSAERHRRLFSAAVTPASYVGALAEVSTSVSGASAGCWPAQDLAQSHAVTGDDQGASVDGGSDRHEQHGGGSGQGHGQQKLIDRDLT
jgi:carboxylate-amine ligase